MLNAYKTFMPRFSSWDEEITLPLTKETALPLICDMLASQYFVTKQGDSAYYYLKGRFGYAIPDVESRYRRIHMASALMTFLGDNGIKCAMHPPLADPSKLKYGTFPMNDADLTDAGKVFYHGRDTMLFIPNLSKNQLIEKLNVLYPEADYANKSFQQPPREDDCCALI